MHSFQPSRGRIFVEFLCALAIVASMVGAWRQTQASALLVAAGAAALLGMIRLFDMSRGTPALAQEPQRIEFEPEAHEETSARLEAVEAIVVELPLASDLAREEPVAAKPEAPRSGSGRRKGGSRKGSGRRAGSRAKVAEVAPVVEAEAEELRLADPPEAEDAPPIEEPEAAGFEPMEPITHIPHAPLFEPEPFVRMPRQAFGRRGRI